MEVSLFLHVGRKSATSSAQPDSASLTNFYRPCWDVGKPTSFFLKNLNEWVMEVYDWADDFFFNIKQLQESWFKKKKKAFPWTSRCLVLSHEDQSDQFPSATSSGGTAQSLALRNTTSAIILKQRPLSLSLTPLHCGLNGFLQVRFSHLWKESWKSGRLTQQQNVHQQNWSLFPH